MPVLRAVVAVGPARRWPGRPGVARADADYLDELAARRCAEIVGPRAGPAGDARRRRRCRPADRAGAPRRPPGAQAGVAAAGSSASSTPSACWRSPAGARPGADDAARAARGPRRRRAARCSLPRHGARPGWRGRIQLFRNLFPRDRCLFQERPCSATGARFRPSFARRRRAVGLAASVRRHRRRPSSTRTWSPSLAVRFRRPGDRFRPLGLGGPQEAAGLLRRPQGAPRRARRGSRSSSIATTGSSGWPDTRFPRISA